MMSTTEEESTSEALASPKATSTPNQEVGAKRRKPQKTNRLTIKVFYIILNRYRFYKKIFDDKKNV